MNDEAKARLILLNSIEAGSSYWANEVIKNGALKVLNGINAGFYDGAKNSVIKIKERIREVNVDGAIAEIERCEGLFIYPEHELWPTQLNDLKIPPFGLIVKGELEYLSSSRQSIAIVGTRNPTNYGSRIASDFAAGLADRDWAVISGGALGIDSAAHLGALAAEGITFGVLGGGVNRPYPLANSKLFDEIQRKGVLISEVMPNVHPVPHRFLVRNRLIAALSKGTIVVEAAYRSGSLRTARDAAEIFRPVMAVPGPINVPTSEGCHKLISERCAEIVASVSDVLELVNPIAL
jgi:DNA processing protein